MRTQTKPQIHHISGPPTGDVWIWRCNRPRCMEWTYTPNIAMAPRGIGYASKWHRAARDLEQHMSDEHPVNSTRLAAFLVAAAGLVLGVVALVLSLLVGSDDPASPAPAPSPSSSSTWSPECTAEDLDDGACYTWDDIRNQPVYSQSPAR